MFQHDIRQQLFGIAGAVLISTVPAANAQAPNGRVPMGTMRCTLDPGTLDEKREPRSLSCLFEPISGPQTTFEGTIRRLGDPASSADRLVLIWSVLGPQVDTPVKALDGLYRGTLDQGGGSLEQPEGGLVGGVDGKIELRALTRVPDHEDATTLILELDLKRMKA